MSLYRDFLATIFVFGIFYCVQTSWYLVGVLNIYPAIKEDMTNLHYNTTKMVNLRSVVELRQSKLDRNKSFEGYVAYAKRIMLQLNDTRELVASFDDYTIVVKDEQ